MANESLESLLTQALNHAHKAKALKADLCAVRVHRKCESVYGNPANWRAGGLIELLHRGKLGELSNLGLFQEFFYRSTDARKLTRFTSEPGGLPVRVEFVSGDYWLAPRAQPFHEFEETPTELLALQSRFEELMEEFEEELEYAPTA